MQTHGSDIGDVQAADTPPRMDWRSTDHEIPEDMTNNRLYSILDVQLPKRKDARSLRESRSLPSAAQELSRKLSGKFGPSTVVHRTNKKARPSLGSIPSYLASPVDSTNPSSLQSRFASTAEVSTAKTSFEASSAPLATSKGSDKVVTPALTVVEELGTEDEIELENKSPLPIEAPENVTPEPTITTVEAAANAKIFLETLYNHILTGTETARETRRRKLNMYLEISRLSPEDREKEEQSWNSKETEHLRKLRILKSQSAHIAIDGRIPTTLTGFRTVRVLGKGSFGVVRLVRGESEDRHDSGIDATPVIPGEVYAMKVIRKSDMIRNGQEGHIRAERDFLVASENSRWVVPLITSFQDHSHLYLVMEYMIGGDFLGMLIAKDRLEEKKAQFYIAEMVLCLEEAHRLKWIHRDAKPDNFLISSSGHLKISDFGLAFNGHWAHDQNYYHCQRYSLVQRLGISIAGDGADREEIGRAEADGKESPFLNHRELKARQRHGKSSVDEGAKEQSILQWRNRYGRRALAKTVVGTSQYMAPEVIHGEEYDGRCDWWSLGIILYEVIHRRLACENEAADSVVVPVR